MGLLVKLLPSMARHYKNSGHKKTRFRGLFRLSRGARERTRTSTELPPLAPEASASTNSATRATQERDYVGRFWCRQQFCEEWAGQLQFPNPGNEKTRFRGFDLETWCPEEDSNLHGVAPAST